MEKGCCELCSKPARMYCDSDQARLCWDCDEKVHSANFLVAKHSRSLLCHVCQSPTPWKASGTKLGPTISVCESCFDNSTVENPATRMRIRRQEQAEEAQDETESLGDGYSESGNDDEYSEFDDFDEDEDDEEIEEVEDDEEDGENQVVPWSSCPTPSSSAPPLTTSSSSEHGSFSTRDGATAVSSALKRSRDNRHLDSDDEDVSCSSQVNLNTGAMENRRACFRSLKMARAEEEEDLVHRPETETELRRRRRMELLGSFMSFQQTTAGNLQHNNTSSEVIRRISKLSRDAL